MISAGLNKTTLQPAGWHQKKYEYETRICELAKDLPGYHPNNFAPGSAPVTVESYWRAQLEDSKRRYQALPEAEKKGTASKEDVAYAIFSAGHLCKNRLNEAEKLTRELEECSRCCPDMRPEADFVLVLRRMEGHILTERSKHQSGSQYQYYADFLTQVRAEQEKPLRLIHERLNSLRAAPTPGPVLAAAPFEVLTDEPSTRIHFASPPAAVERSQPVEPLASVEAPVLVAAGAVASPVVEQSAKPEPAASRARVRWSDVAAQRVTLAPMGSGTPDPDHPESNNSVLRNMPANDLGERQPLLPPHPDYPPLPRRPITAGLVFQIFCAAAVVIPAIIAAGFIMSGTPFPSFSHPQVDAATLQTLAKLSPPTVQSPAPAAETSDSDAVTTDTNLATVGSPSPQEYLHRRVGAYTATFSTQLDQDYAEAKDNLTLYGYRLTNNNAGITVIDRNTNTIKLANRDGMSPKWVAVSERFTIDLAHTEDSFKASQFKDNGKVNASPVAIPNDKVKTFRDAEINQEFPGFLARTQTAVRRVRDKFSVKFSSARDHYSSAINRRGPAAQPSLG